MIDELKQWEYDRGYEKGKTDVLDKIRAEIKEDSDKWKDTLFGDGIRYCLRIIDKYREGNK